MDRGRRPGFFVGAISSNRDLVAGIRNVRYQTWTPGSISFSQQFFLSKLRQGVHPGYIEWEAYQQLANTPQGAYDWHFLRSLISIHSRLRALGLFDGLPSIGELDAVERLLDKRIILENMIRERFIAETYESLTSYYNPRCRRPSLEYADIRHYSPEALSLQDTLQQQQQQQQTDELHDLRTRITAISTRLDGAEARLASRSPTFNQQEPVNGRRGEESRHPPPATNGLAQTYSGRAPGPDFEGIHQRCPLGGGYHGPVQGDPLRRGCPQAPRGNVQTQAYTQGLHGNARVQDYTQAPLGNGQSQYYQQAPRGNGVSGQFQQYHPQGQRENERAQDYPQAPHDTGMGPGFGGFGSFGGR